MLEKIKKMITKNPPKKVTKKEPMLASADQDKLVESEYLNYSAEAVGYDNRELQWSIYRTVLQYIPEGTSLLDFGCGRGDLHAFGLSEYKEELDYTGVDFKESLVNAGKEIYPKLAKQLHIHDWFKMPKGLIADWCINTGSNNLRYDADMTKDDFEYLCDTIDVMYDRANDGIVILLTSGEITNGFLSHDPGRILNWCQRKYGNVILDHSVSESGFCLIINK